VRWNLHLLEDEEDEVMREAGERSPEVEQDRRRGRVSSSKPVGRDTVGLDNAIRNLPALRKPFWIATQMMLATLARWRLSKLAKILLTVLLSCSGRVSAAVTVAKTPSPSGATFGMNAELEVLKPGGRAEPPTKSSKA
jgi:hypothetical protein